MNCFYHPEKEAVAQCTECNKGLCNECATRFNKPICDSCARKVLKSQLSYYWTPLIVSVVLFVVVYIIYFSILTLYNIYIKIFNWGIDKSVFFDKLS